MAMAFGWMELLLLLLSGGSGNDVLDLIETKSYWREKNVPVAVQTMMDELKAGPAVDVAPLIKDLSNEEFSKREEAARKLLAVGPAALPQLKEAAHAQDPEVASQAKRLIRKLEQGSMAQSVRRLMAIRTLGELKDAAAVTVLKPLLNSKTLFEADYAEQAIAAIEGKPYTRKRTDTKLLMQDLGCLPKPCGVLAKLEMQPGTPLDIAKILSEAEGLPAGFDKEKALAQMQQMIIGFAERLGNIRLESITLGVSEEIGNRTGHIAVIARGVYNRDAVKAALMEMKLPSKPISGVDVFPLDREGQLFLPSSHQAAILMGPHPQPKLTEALAKALKEPPAQPSLSKEMTALFETVDAAAPIWTVARISKSYREAPLLAPFDSITIQGKQDKGIAALDLKAIGKDTEKVASAVKMFEEGLKEGLASLERAPQAKMMKPMVDFMRSLQAKQDGQAVHVTGKMTGAGVAVMMPFIWLVAEAPMPADGPPPVPKRAVRQK